MKQKYLIALIIAILCSNGLLFAQNANVKTITGTVVDEFNEPIIGASVYIKNQPGIGTATDIDGNFKLTTNIYETLVITYLGYKQEEVQLEGKTTIHVQLSIDEGKGLEELVVVGAQKQRKVSVVGAISTVDVDQLKVPTANLSNALAGNVAGIIAVQRSGEPGQNFSEFWIRGKSTFGAGDAALVLVDGVERNFNEINVEDIASFSVLKDASATAIYGQRGANGVIIVETKRGVEGKASINFKGEYGMSTPSRMPKYVDAVRYAELANEGRQSRYLDPLYTDADMDVIRYGLDPDLYPNVDWYDLLLNDFTTQYRGNVSISGGSSTARYYISASYLSEEGMYKENNLNAYNTNANYNRFNFRSNVDVSVTKTTEVSLGIGGWLVNQNKPGAISDDIWGSLSGLSSLTVPVVYSNGLFPSYGGSGIQISPKVWLTETGYKTMWENKIETNLGIKQDLKFITPGLTAEARFSFDTFNFNQINRLKYPDLYRAERQRDGQGRLVLSRVFQEVPLYQGTESRADLRYFGEFNLNYGQVFDDKHRVGGLFRATMEERSDRDPAFFSDILFMIPKRYLAYAGRFTYSYDDRYFIEGNLGYTGSENFEKGSRFGLFPAIAGGWMLSNESFMQSLTWLDQLKFRYSYGKTGNDKMRKNDRDVRFPYLTSVDTGAGGFNYGDIGQGYGGGVYLNTVGAINLTWETSTKHNAGIDMTLFKDFNLIVDVFQDYRERIFMERNYIPYTVGLEGLKPWANVGRMRNQGMDGNFSYFRKVGDVNVTLRGNFTYAYSDVLEYDEQANALDYQMTKGYRWEQTRGLIALGLFKDEQEILESPRQTFMTDVLPGDIKYKDVNGDGVINNDDVVPIGYSRTPGLIYGFGSSVEWNNFDFNVLFQGAGNSDFFLGGVGVDPFSSADFGNILKAVSDNNDRWISREISGTADTENPDAVFPRLSYGSNLNNHRNSTFWLRNARYLRLKHLEVGYTIPRAISQKLMMNRVRVYCIGTNLLVFSPFDWWDPEIGSSNGAKYPISKTVTLGLTVAF